MAIIIKGDQHKKTTQDILREFNDRFMGVYAMGPDNTWFEVISDTVITDSPEIVFPFPVDAGGYREFKGEYKYRSLDGRRAKLKPRLWQDGVKESADKMKQASWLGWDTQAAKLARDAAMLPGQLIAELLAANSAAGPYLGIYDDDDIASINATYTLFHDAHLNDLLDSSHGTFDNNGLAGVGGITTDNVAAWFAHFEGLKAPNGVDTLGLTFTHLLVPRTRFRAAKDFFAKDYLPTVFGSNTAAVMQENVYKGSVEVIVSDRLTDQNVVYPLALNKPEMVPFVVMRQDAPEITTLDESSALYEATREIAVRGLHKVNVGAMFPQPIAKVTLS